jgi:hypothetical protein
MLAALKDTVRVALPEDRQMRAELSYAKGQGLDPRGDPAHREYLDEVCAIVLKTAAASMRQAAATQSALSKDPLVVEILAHDKLRSAKVESFVGQAAPLKAICSHAAGVADDEASGGSGSGLQPFVLHGASGCGKTSLMAKAVTELRRTLLPDHVAVVTRFLGTTASSFKLRPLLASLCQQLAVIFRTESESLAETAKLREELLRLLALASKEHPVVLFLDSLDQLQDADGGRALVWLPAKLPPFVRLVVSTLPVLGGCLATLRGKMSQDGTVPEGSFLQVPQLGPTDAKALLRKWLEKAGRTVTEQQLAAILAAFQQCPLPLYLRLACYLGVQWQSAAAAEQLAADVPGLIATIFDQLEGRHGKALVFHALGYLTAARHGVTATEMSDLLSLDDTVLRDVFQW